MRLEQPGRAWLASGTNSSVMTRVVAGSGARPVSMK